MMIGQVIQAMKVNCNVKRPPMSSKNEMLIFGLHSASDQLSDPSDKSQPKCKKGPLSHHKMKCLFMDYIQLLMISQVIQAMKVTQNAKKAPKSSKNEMLIIGLRSTSDNRPNDLSNKSQPKCKNTPYIIKK